MKILTRLGVVACVAAAATGAAAQEPLTQVKALYDSASYSEALSALSTVDSSADIIDVEKYRALCLLALGRPREAEQSLQTLAMNRPLYNFDVTDSSPRLVTLYEDIKRRTLPEASKQIYQRARASFDTGKMADAARQFKEVVALADGAPEEHAVFMSELKMLAAGFVRLAETAPSPAPPTSRVDLPPAAPAAVSATSAIDLKVASQEIYDISHSDVRPPVASSRRMPRWIPADPYRYVAFRGTLEVIVAEDGSVAGAKMLVATHPAYDDTLVSAARDWRYAPALKEGRAVRYRVLYPLVLEPASR